MKNIGRMRAMLAASSLPAASEEALGVYPNGFDPEPWRRHGGVGVIGATRERWSRKPLQSIEEIREAKAAAEAKRQRRAAKRLRLQ